MDLLKGAEFIRKVSRLGKQDGIEVEYRAERGKGSHGTLYFGG
jgi:mRNA interferase HicA